MEEEEKLNFPTFNEIAKASPVDGMPSLPNLTKIDNTQNDKLTMLERALRSNADPMDLSEVANRMYNFVYGDQNEMIQKVKQFMEAFGHPIANKPIIPSKDVCELRYNLILEELNELKEAYENEDIVEVADALTDIAYVLFGAVLTFGMHKMFMQMFEEVHSSNMSKGHSRETSAERTRDHMTDKGIKCTIQSVNGTYTVVREDGKLLKNINYKPADMAKFF